MPTQLQAPEQQGGSCGDAQGADNMYVVGDTLMLTVNTGTLAISPGLVFDRTAIDRSQSSQHTIPESRTVNDENSESRSSDVVRITRSGILRAQTKKQDPSQRSLRLDFLCRRYIPMQGDHVIGIIHGRLNDYYTVDINSHSLAFLPQLAFEGVTNRSKPNLTACDLLFCKVNMANPDSHSEVTCVEKKSGKANGMGVLGGTMALGRRGVVNGGMLLMQYRQLSSVDITQLVSPYYARRLNSDKASILQVIGKEIEFESAIGMNGRVWIRGKDDKHTMAIYRVLYEFHNKPLNLKLAKQRLLDYLIT